MTSPARTLLVAMLLAAAVAQPRDAVPAETASGPQKDSQSPRVAMGRLEIDLAGMWAFRLDPRDAGVQGAWFRRELTGRIRLPGSLQEQGFGNDVSVDTQWTGGIQDSSWYTSPRYEKYRQPGNVKVPFWLQPDKHYVGVAWYQRQVTIPNDWEKKRIVLYLERPHWETMVWVDETLLGMADSLSTPHTHALPAALSPGPHRLTIRVDNRLKVGVGVNAHSVTDHTQSNWNGLVGQLRLRVSDRIWIDDLQIYPDAASRSANVKLVFGNATGRSGRGFLTINSAAYDTGASRDTVRARLAIQINDAAKTPFEHNLVLGENTLTWDEFQPALQGLAATLEVTTDEGISLDEAAASFGLRTIATQGTQFILNGRPIFLRGTLECCIFPRTGYPPTDIDSWSRIIRICQAHGLNHMRFHSWCPPEAAFTAADGLGFYFHIECAAWSNQGSTIGDGKPIDGWLYAEADRILKAYGNHPSFLLMAYGNEPAGPGQGAKFLGPFVEHYRAQDPRRLYTSGSGWPLIPQNQYHSTPAPRIHAWGEGLRDRINGRAPETVTDYRDFVGKYTVPVVSHEIGQWCVYPNLEEAAKYTGVLRARNFEIFRDFLRQNHLGDQARDFLMASGKLQVLCYKEEIESALRTPGFGGFQLLDLHDFPGQGTALVGVLDPFWDSKPYVTPAEFRRFCQQTVPLARLPKRILTNQEVFQADIEVYHFGPHDMDQAEVVWKLVSQTRMAIAKGQFPARTIRAGQLNRIGPIQIPLRDVASPQEMRLVVGIEGSSFENDWDVWAYPAAQDTAAPRDVLLTQQLDEAALARLSEGGKVLWNVPAELLQGGIAIGFSPVFWNTAWTNNQPPHTLGILCEPRHPALAKFPTQYHTNWQWWELISRSGAMQLDKLPPNLRPIVRVIDTWFEARRLALVFEAQVSGGKLLVCSADITHDLDQRPVARQMRQSLLAYMASGDFQPQVAVSAAAIRGLCRVPSKMEQRGPAASADSQQPYRSVSARAKINYRKQRWMAPSISGNVPRSG